MIHFQALWKTKSFVKVCLKFKLPLWTNGLLIHLSPLWQLPLWHFPRWHNFPVYMDHSGPTRGQYAKKLTKLSQNNLRAKCFSFWGSKITKGSILLIKHINKSVSKQARNTTAYVTVELIDATDRCSGFESKTTVFL